MSCLSFLKFQDLDGVDPLGDPFMNASVFLEYFCDYNSDTCINTSSGAVNVLSMIVKPLVQASLTSNLRNSSGSGFLGIVEGSIELIDAADFTGPFVCRNETVHELYGVFQDAVEELNKSTTSYHEVTTLLKGSTAPEKINTSRRLPRDIDTPTFSIGSILSEWVALNLKNTLLVKEELLKLAIDSYRQASATKNLTIALVSTSVSALNGDYTLAYQSFWLHQVIVMNSITRKLDQINEFLRLVVGSSRLARASKWECSPLSVKFLKQDCFAGTNTIRQLGGPDSTIINLVTESGALRITTRSESLCVPFMLKESFFICNWHKQQVHGNNRLPPPVQRPIQAGDESLMLGTSKVFFLTDGEYFTLGCLPDVSLLLNMEKFTCTLSVGPQDNWFQLPLFSLKFAGIEYVHSEQVDIQHPFNMTLQHSRHTIARMPRFWVHKHELNKIQHLKGLFRRLQEHPSGVASLTALIIGLLTLCIVIPLCCKVLPGLFTCTTSWLQSLLTMCTVRSQPEISPSAPPLATEEQQESDPVNFRTQTLPLLYMANPALRRATLND